MKSLLGSIWERHRGVFALDTYLITKRHGIATFAGSPLSLFKLVGLEPASIDVPLPIRQSSEKRRNEYIAGRICAFAALCELGTESEALLGRDELSGTPVWPAGTVGSLTHKDDFTSAAVGLRNEMRGLGIDTENYLSLASAEDLVGYVATPEELSFCCGRLRIGLETGMTLLFSAKESAFKALQSRLTRLPSYLDFQVTKAELLNQSLEFHLHHAGHLEISQIKVWYRLDRQRLHTSCQA